MNPISENLRAQIEAQATPQDAAFIIDYLQEHSDGNPEFNVELSELVNDFNYADRGMHGPLGGNGGTVSRFWLEEWKRINEGGPSELSLMTIIAPPPKEKANLGDNPPEK